MEGLRVLAHVIARHYLEHPELYPAPNGNIDGGTGSVGDADATVNALVVADGNAGPKEADQ